MYIHLSVPYCPRIFRSDVQSSEPTRGLLFRMPRLRIRLLYCVVLPGGYQPEEDVQQGEGKKL